MKLKFEAKDRLTGELLAPGIEVVGVKLGGQWDFTAESIDRATFKILCEALLFSMDPEEGGPNGSLDHEDYYLLQEFGEKYDHFARQIGCEVPGLGIG